jgi:uncharacterized protein YndB with AHSA1/START domain
MRTPEQSTTVTRVFDASADTLYAAWTDPKIMERWMAQTVEADVRVGGRYRNELDAGGASFVHTGEYVALEPGRRIVQTFHAGPAGSMPEAAGAHTNEFLDIQLRPLGLSQTELTLTDGWDGEALDEEGEQAAKQAWNGWLDQLQKLF